jgi:hypothetical protein
VVVACFMVSLLSQHLVGKDWRKSQNMGNDSSCTLQSSSDTECAEIQYPFLNVYIPFIPTLPGRSLYPADWWFSGHYTYGDDVICSSSISSSSDFLSPECFLPGTPYYMKPNSRKDSVSFTHSFQELPFPGPYLKSGFHKLYMFSSNTPTWL